TRIDGHYRDRAVCAIGQTLESIETDGSRRCLTWTILSPAAVPLWLRMQRTNPFARLSLAQFLTLGPFSKGCASRNALEYRKATTRAISLFSMSCGDRG